MKMAYSRVEPVLSSTSRLMAKPAMALPRVDTAVPRVMMVKSRVHRS